MSKDKIKLCMYLEGFLTETLKYHLNTFPSSYPLKLEELTRL